MSEFAESFDAALEQARAVSVAQEAAGTVDSAIAQAVQASAERVEAAQMTSEDRLAKAIARELKGQVLETDSTDLYVPTEDDEETDEATARLEAELEQSGEDLEIGPDAEGNMIYRDAETGEDYILT